MMKDLMVVGLCKLRTIFDTYKQFICCFCNIFSLNNVITLHGIEPLIKTYYGDSHV